jgi:phosphonate transport system ATP-binding protein
MSGAINGVAHPALSPSAAPLAWTTQPTAAPLLQVTGLGHGYAGRAVLQGVQLQVQPGEFVALLGASGAGKTTLLKCITGALPPQQGSVQLAGVDLASTAPRDRRQASHQVAVVFQQFNLVRRLSALDNVLAGRLGHVPAWRGCLRQFSRADRLLALQCLDRVGLLAQAGQRADTLSGGQQQRVAIARALAQQARLIVADEPVASLDPAISADILGLLQGICRDDGVAVVCSLHQLHLARQFAHRLVGLRDGQVVFDTTAAALSAAQANALYAPSTTPTPTP